MKDAALRLGLTVLTPALLRPFVAEARNLGADAFVVASYGKIVPQAMLDLVPIAFNVHPSLLPLYRGATPLQSAIRDGRTQTGVTIMAMDAGMDTGDVLLRERTPLGSDETYGMLHDRLAARGAVMIVDALDRHAAGTLRRTTQDAVAEAEGIAAAEIAATLTRPWRKDDYVLDLTRGPDAALNLVRAAAPQPGARLDTGAEIVKVLAARRAAPDETGASVTSDGGFVAGGIVLLRVTPPNRGPMSAAAWRASAVSA